MSTDVVETEPFPPEAEEMMRDVLALCEGKDVQIIANVLVNALCVVIQPSGEFDHLRSFVCNMIDAYAARAQQAQTGELPKD